jgi:hypothetical protein
MRLKLLILACAAIVGLPATARANDQTCSEQRMHECAMPCCQTEKNLDGLELWLSMAGGLTTAEELFPAPAPQRAVVWFHRPVWVGRNVLMGQYVIEHDTERQARGEPCTHIYAMDDQRTPVVAFHCTHLEAARSDSNVVVLQSKGDSAQKLLRFQFAGEDAAHGYPDR